MPVELNKDAPEAVEETVSDVSEKTKSYSPEFVDKLMRERKNWQARAKELEDVNRKQEESSLLEKQEYKTLYENTIKDNETLKSTIATYNEEKVDNAKQGELRREFAKLGLQANYFDKATKLIDVNSIRYDSDTGVIIGAEEAARALQTEMPVLFGKPSTNVSGAAPQGSPRPLTIDEWKKLDTKERIERESDLYASYGVTRTT